MFPVFLLLLLYVTSRPLFGRLLCVLPLPRRRGWFGFHLSPPHQTEVPWHAPHAACTACASLLLTVRYMRAPRVAVGCLGLLLGASSWHQTPQPHRGGGGMGRWPVFMHGHGLKHSCVLVQVLVCSSRWLAPPAAVQEPHGSSHGPVLGPGALLIILEKTHSCTHASTSSSTSLHQRSYLQSTAWQGNYEYKSYFLCLIDIHNIPYISNISYFFSSERKAMTSRE